jgi:hypothetical protein
MEEVLVYVKPICKNTNNTYEYDLFFSDTPDYVWGPMWDVDNPSLNGDITPDKTTYTTVKRLRTNLPLKTLEETSCYSMEYATYQIMALSWIDIENLEVYPEKGRMVMYFGESMTSVNEKVEYAEWEWVK